MLLLRMLEELAIAGHGYDIALCALTTMDITVNGGKPVMLPTGPLIVAVTSAKQRISHKPRLGLNYWRETQWDKQILLQ